MVVTMNIQVDTSEATARLKQLGRVNDLSTPLKQAGVYMEGSIAKRFRAAKWKPLSEATIKWHPHRAGGKPLNDTGKLRLSVTSGAIQRVSKHQLRYGTNLKYAAIHNFGGSTPLGTRIPARPFLYFDGADQQAIKRIFEDWLESLSKS